MNTPVDNTPAEEEKPLDPATEALRQRLVRLLAVSIGVMVIGLLAVVIAVVYKINQESDDAPVVADNELSVPAGVSYEGMVKLPQGAKVSSSSISGNRLSLTVEMADGGQEIWLYDLQTARIFGRISIQK